MRSLAQRHRRGRHVGLYKIFVYFGAIVHESTLIVSLPPTCMAYASAILFHDYNTVEDSVSDLPFVCYTNTILVITISCKG